MPFKDGTLSWIEAEEFRQTGVALQYRDGGAFHRSMEWLEVDGSYPITDHMSDFEWRVKPAGTANEKLE